MAKKNAAKLSAEIKPSAEGGFFNPVGGWWLLWAGFGGAALLLSLGVHWAKAQFFQLFFVTWWAVANFDGHWFVRLVVITVSEVFFKDFDVAGTARVPETGAVIFACAPHASQFVDGMVVCRAIPRTDLGLLVAQSTMESRWVGKVARAAQSIGVARPQDIGKPGQGKIAVEEDGITITGIDTIFDTQCEAGDQLVWVGGSMKGVLGTILTVDSHSRIVLKKPVEGKDRGTGHAYKILPKIDQSAVFKQVFQRLAQHGAIGIWPEGGSHDRTELLPFKAGISMMALGAMAETPGLNLTIVPVGINYFRGHRFRSRVFVDIGEPIKPTPEMVEKYQQGGDDKRWACGSLLEEIRAGIRCVTIEAKDFDTLQLFRLMRRLHTSNLTEAAGTGGIPRSPSFVKPFNSIPPLEKFDLIKAFAIGWEKIKDEPEAKVLATDILEYRRLLKSYGLPDFRIARAAQDQAFAQGIYGTSYLVVRTIVAILQLFVCAIFVVPGVLMSLPMLLTTRFISKREAAKAAKKSSVKIVGRDVLATWKLMVAIVLVPIMHLSYTFIAFLLYGEVGAVAWFFFAPFGAAVGVFSTELGVKLLYSIVPLIKGVIKKDTGLELAAKRKGLQRQVAIIVKKFGLLEENQ